MALVKGLFGMVLRSEGTATAEPSSPRLAPTPMSAPSSTSLRTRRRRVRPKPPTVRSSPTPPNRYSRHRTVSSFSIPRTSRQTSPPACRAQARLETEAELVPGGKRRQNYQPRPGTHVGRARTQPQSGGGGSQPRRLHLARQRSGGSLRGGRQPSPCRRKPSLALVRYAGH
jgi:hypothetical protein